MKKPILLIAAGSALLFGACTSSTKNETADTALPAPADSVADTVSADTVSADSLTVANIPFKAKKFQKKKGDDELEIEYPVEGNPELLKSIRNWISEGLSGTFKGNPDDAEAFFKHYASKLGQMSEMGEAYKDEFDLEYQNNFVVTYEYSNSVDDGEGWEEESYGTTFLQKDGSIFGKDCFKSYNDMKRLFTEGLKTYFKVKSDAELAKKLNPGVKVTSIGAPARNPWIDEDGIVFSYSPNEIAPTRETPRFTLTYDQIAPYLNDKGKAFFN